MAKVQIYATAICPYCVAAKNLLKHKGLDYEEIRVDKDPVGREEMIARTHRRTVPQIFVNGTHIGGYDELVAAEHSGTLSSLLGGAA